MYNRLMIVTESHGTMLSLHFSLNFILLLSMCVFLCTCAYYICSGHRMISDLLDLEVREVVILTWLLGKEVCSRGKGGSDQRK